jgi:hypothetical protein
MVWIDYGQVPSIKPNFKNVRVVRNGKGKIQCKNLKYIQNEFLNSANRGYNGFSLVGQDKVTGKWRILRIWGYW